jgi:hypothetical protein
MPAPHSRQSEPQVRTFRRQSGSTPDVRWGASRASPLAVLALVVPALFLEQPHAPVPPAPPSYLMSELRTWHIPPSSEWRTPSSIPRYSSTESKMPTAERVDTAEPTFWLPALAKHSQAPLPLPLGCIVRQRIFCSDNCFLVEPTKPHCSPCECKLGLSTTSRYRRLGSSVSHCLVSFDLGFPGDRRIRANGHLRAFAFACGCKSGQCQTNSISVWIYYTTLRELAFYQLWSQCNHRSATQREWEISSASMGLVKIDKARAKLPHHRRI